MNSLTIRGRGAIEFRRQPVEQHVLAHFEIDIEHRHAVAVPRQRRKFRPRFWQLDSILFVVALVLDQASATFSKLNGRAALK